MKKIIMLLGLFASLFSNAQDGTIDASFDPAEDLNYSNQLAINYNGNIYQSGYSGSTLKLDKFSPTGQLLTFYFGPLSVYASSESPSIGDILIENNGNYFIGGNFEYFGRHSLIKVDQNGTINDDFIPQLPIDFTVKAIAIQPITNKIIVGGHSSSSSRIYRLDYTTGAIDTTFNNGQIGISGNNGNVYAIATSSTGDIYIGGNFLSYNGVTRNGIAKLNPNGTLNSGFVYNTIDMGLGVIYNITVQSNGGILVAGGFHDTATGRRSLLRFNSNGTLDNSFNPILNSTGAHIIHDLAIQSTGKIIIAGEFKSIDGTTRYSIARLFENGDLDPCFISAFANGDVIQQIAVNNSDDIYTTQLVATGQSLKRLNGSTTTEAVNNSGSINGISGGIAVTNVLSNDTLNGQAATTSNVTLSQVSSTNSGVTLNPSTGAVNVAPNTPAGTYTLVYQICPTGSTCNCDTAQVTITVNTITEVIAVNDNYQIVAGNNAVTGVRANDTINGAPATTSNSTVTLTNAPGFGLTSSGVLTVGASVAPGSYTLTYELCSTSTPVVCDTATITVTVLGIVNAVNDNIEVCHGIPFEINILSNDTYSGQQASQSNINISLLSSLPSGVTFNPSTGVISGNSNVSVNTYTINYKICDDLSSSNCDNATLTITVLNCNILANDDQFLDICINGIEGGLSEDITQNDTFNGSLVNDGDITITLIDNDGINNLSINSLGIISVPAGTPFGIYEITYQICYNNSPTVCSTATVRFCVNNGLNMGDGPNNTVYDVVIQPDGYILVGGAFTEWDGIPRNRILRLKPDLSLDDTFDPNGIGFNNTVYSIALQGNRVLVGGIFTATTNGINRSKLARLYSDGSLDTLWVNNNFDLSTTQASPSSVRCIKVMPSGNIMVGGHFHSVNSSTDNGTTNVIMLKSTGDIISSFNSLFYPQPGISSDASGTIFDIHVYDDETMLLAGGGGLRLDSDPTYDRWLMIKVSTTGSLDNNFTVVKAYGAGGSSFINDIHIHNERIIIGGQFSHGMNYYPRNLVQLKPTGDYDTSCPINSTGGSNSIVYSLVDDLNNNIVVGGWFTQYDGITVESVFRLKPDGTFDTSFNNPYLDFTGQIYRLAIQNDNKIVLGGNFHLSDQGNTVRFLTRIVGDASPIYQGRPLATEQFEQTGKKVTIYPNPSTDIFNIDFSGYENEKFEIAIYNTLGQLITQQDITATTVKQIDLSNYESGNYFIRLVNGSETINKIITLKR